jgi:hypothetical protein
VEYDEDAFDDDQDQDDYINDGKEEDVPLLGQFEDINDEDNVTLNNYGDASEDQQSDNESDNESGDDNQDSHVYTAGVAPDVEQGINNNEANDQDQDDYINDGKEEDVPLLGQFEDINDEDNVTLNNYGDASEDQHSDNESDNESRDDDQDPHDDTEGVAPDVEQGINNNKANEGNNDSDDEEEDSEDEDEYLNPVTDANVNDDEGDNEGNEEDRRTTRSGRILKAPKRLNLAQHNLKVDKSYNNQEEYNLETSRVIVLTMCYMMILRLF